MRQFLVPQFIDVEDKILGPITVRQFILIIIGGGIDFMIWRLADFYFFLVVGVPVAAITVVFAFIRVNGRPMHYFVLNIIESLRRPSLRVWDKEFTVKYGKPKAEKTAPAVAPIVYKKPLRSSRLSELALMVDTGGSYKEEEEEGG